MGSVFSSRVFLVVPHFLWRGRWFWGAWLLVFLLPLTRHEARLHFIGSRFFSALYEQPWQERWMTDVTPGLTPLERAIWDGVRDRGQGFASYSYSGQNTDPNSTAAGRALRAFPREKWLRALALRQSLGWSSLAGVKSIKWARQGERTDPGNAFYPLALAKSFGDSGRRAESEAALQRAANCTRFDDGISTLKTTALRAARKAGVATWSEEWNVWSGIDNSWYMVSNQLQQLLGQCVVLSQNDMAFAGKKNAPARMRAALKRSNALMRVSLLLQRAPCDAKMWSVGANWMRGAWEIARKPGSSRRTYNATVTEFTAFALAQNSAPNVRLAQKCAARARLLAAFIKPNSGLSRGAMFSTPEAMWADASGPVGFCVLTFGFYLMCWWWLISLFGWRAVGRESSRPARLLPAVMVIAGTLTAFGLLTIVVVGWLNAPALARRGPPPGQAEVTIACGLFAFFAPPLLLALWCAGRAQRKNRAVLALPARAQLEMNLSPLDAFMLGRATGTFALALLGLGVAFSLLWGLLRWHALSGYDWLRFLWPGLSPRVIDPALTSLDSPATPTYAALCMITLTLVWLISWRYSTDPTRRPVFHDALRAWKEAIGCALTLTVWVYLALLLVCHISGTVFSNRLDVVSARGEGAFVSGF